MNTPRSLYISYTGSMCQLIYMLNSNCKCIGRRKDVFLRILWLPRLHVGHGTQVGSAPLSSERSGLSLWGWLWPKGRAHRSAGERAACGRLHLSVSGCGFAFAFLLFKAFLTCFILICRCID